MLRLCSAGPRVFLMQSLTLCWLKLRSLEVHSSRRDSAGPAGTEVLGPWLCRGAQRSSRWGTAIGLIFRGSAALPARGMTPGLPVVISDSGQPPYCLARSGLVTALPGFSALLYRLGRQPIRPVCRCVADSGLRGGGKALESKIERRTAPGTARREQCRRLCRRRAAASGDVTGLLFAPGRLAYVPMAAL